MIARTAFAPFCLMVLAGCGGNADATVSPAPGECAEAPAEDDGLDLDAARAAHRDNARAHELRMLEALHPGSTLASLEAMLARPDGPCLADLQSAGRIVFEHELSFADGLGSGDARALAAPPFRRVQRGRFGGPETTACTSCHWRGGQGGAGALQDNAFLLGDGNRVSSADARNPPALHGVAVAQRLAEEMSAELDALRRGAIERARAQGRALTVELSAKGVGFGSLRVAADGTVDTRGVRGIDADLVVRPFGWKGNFATLDEFVAEALQAHFGVQADALVDRARGDTGLLGDGPPDDPDGDGQPRELSDTLLLALLAHLAALPLPIVEPWQPLSELPPRAEPLNAPTAQSFLEPWVRGRALFEEIGCAQCHRPMLLLEDPVLTLKAGERSLRVDLARSGAEPRLRYDAALGGYPVWLFSDLRRHDLGEANASQHEQRGVAREQYLTRRLWGLANSGPYFHDGRAPSFDGAIAAHDGEALQARLGFEALEQADQGALRTYLMSLRRAYRLSVPR